MAAMTPDDIRALFDLQYQASRSHIDVPLLVRRERLLRVQKMLDEHGAVLAAAVQADFGMRSPRLTEVADFFVLRTLLSHTPSHLARWMKPQKVRTPLFLQPAHGWIARQPLGVVGVISPWNYPVQLALAPAITALAAGNRVMLKPSELTPHTSAQLALLVAQFFAADEFCVVQGDAATAALVASLPFDHLVFTGSTAVGRKVMAAAAPNLTPLTLELGGKSPAIIGEDYPVEKAATRLATGKWFNGGQTCIAPDYVLVPAGKRDALVQALREEVQARYGHDLSNLDDYTRIVNDGQYARLQGYLADAAARGVEVLTLAGQADPAQRLLPPTLLLDPPDASAVMQEEIFGPLLPIKGYRTLDEAIAFVNARDRPLALYPFSNDRAIVDRILQETLAGGVSVNDTLFHFAVGDLPFGGVGASGMGAYHGRAGFDAMTKQLPVFRQARLTGGDLLKPPYAKAKWLLDLIVR